MNNNLVSMSDKQNQLSTGKKINKASDDPVGTTKIIKVKSDIVENEQYKNNVRDAKSWLNVSENSLMDIKDILQRVRELAVQGANGSNTPEDTDKIAKEIQQLTDEIIVNSNATIAGRYLFSGFQTDQRLLNKDGTYNIDVTSEKITDFESISYEVTIGESIQVGTNYIDVFGVVEEDNMVTDTFVFGDVSNNETRYGENKALSATHTKLTGPVDYKKNMTADTLEITVGSQVFTVDSAALDGTITQEEYVDILKSAKQTTPVPTHPVPLLSDVAEIYFAESSDPTNSEGEMVIEAKAFGPVAITINDTGNSYVVNPSLVNGVTGVPPVIANVSGTFDYATDYTTPALDTLTFQIGTETYTVDTIQLDGTINEANFVTLIENAVNGSGDKLGDVMNVNFTPTAGTSGVLEITGRTDYDAVVVTNDGGGGFTAGPIDTNGVKSISEVKAEISGLLDFSKDLTSSSLEYTINGVTYSVDTSTINGSITEENLLNLIQNAPQTSPVPGPPPVQVLSDVADITFTGTTDPDDTIGRVTIIAKTALDSTSLVSDTGSAYTGNPTSVIGVGTIEPIKGKVEGTVDLSRDLSADTLQFQFGSKTYTVATGGMNGTLSEEQFLDRIKNASDGSGGKLSDYMNVTYSSTIGTEGKLVIEQKTGEDAVVNVTDTGGSFVVAPVETDGLTGEISTKAKITGINEITDEMLVDPEKGTGIQSFVVTYNDQTVKIDIDLTNISTMAEMESAVNERLHDAFGDDSGAPPKNNVSFNIVFDGSKNVVQFTGEGKDDGSRASLKVDVIASKKSQLIQDLEDFSAALTTKDDDGIDEFLSKVDDHLDNLLSVIADVGAKDNRMDFIENRIEDNSIAMTKILSLVQDIDYTEVIVKFKSLESIYRASLSAGAKVIQPTLVDFMN